METTVGKQCVAIKQANGDINVVFRRGAKPFELLLVFLAIITLPGVFLGFGNILMLFVYIGAVFGVVAFSKTRTGLITLVPKQGIKTKKYQIAFKDISSLFIKSNGRGSKVVAAVNGAEVDLTEWVWGEAISNLIIGEIKKAYT